MKKILEVILFIILLPIMLVMVIYFKIKNDPYNDEIWASNNYLSDEDFK